ncbi:MAG: hypothetical protein GX858_03435 [Clostridiales bacterium]|nr:hypothetical protein [Clostridiales bacterium]
MNKKLFGQLRMLGEQFEINSSFDTDIVKAMATPYQLSKSKSSFLELLGRLGLGDTMFWNMMLRQNKATERRFDQPFAGSLTDAAK